MEAPATADCVRSLDRLAAGASRASQGVVQFRDMTLLASTLVVGVTGHRNLRAADVPALHGQVRAFFLDLRARYPALPISVLSSLAEGSDQLVAQVALELGLRVVAPLPVP